MRFSMLLMLLALMTTAANAADVAAGKTLFTPCVACHGADAGGNQALNAPRTAGQHSWYVKRQLQAFKDGVRGSNPKDAYGMQMKPMAAMLANDQAINNVVAYIRTLK